LRLRYRALVWAMQRHRARLNFLCIVFLLPISAHAQSTGTGDLPAPSTKTRNRPLLLRAARQLPSDLEVGGEISGIHGGATRYFTRADLLTLPQVSFLVNGDTNFNGPTRISGVRLEDLAKRIASAPDSDMAVAICDDQYRANYPRDYMASHHPVLVLNVNGKPPAGWPKDSVEHKYDMGPYMISHSKFIPSFKILAHSDEPQIPWGVVRIEFRNENTVFGSIAPRGPRAADAAVQAGYRIAKQNCFRCHSSGSEGGTKSGITWRSLADQASAAPEDFSSYIFKPVSKNASAQMPDNPPYDKATLAAITAYFQTFHGEAKP